MPSTPSSPPSPAPTKAHQAPKPHARARPPAVTGRGPPGDRAATPGRPDADPRATGRRPPGDRTRTPGRPDADPRASVEPNAPPVGMRGGRIPFAAALLRAWLWQPAAYGRLVATTMQTRRGTRANSAGIALSRATWA